MRKKELEEKVIILETELSDKKDELNKLVSEAMSNGEHLKSDPFIPEYLGFTESILDDKGEVKARIYTKNGYNISRFVNTNDSRWVILGPKGVSNTLLMENMYNAIIALRASGMNISIEDYFEQNRIQEEKLSEMLDEGDFDISGGVAGV